MKPPIQQAKKHLLQHLRTASPEVKEIVYPCLPQDIGDYRRALELVEVQAEFNRRGVKAILKTASRSGKISPDIIIATAKDVASGKLDERFRDDS
ncbi:hypothetical protein PI95_031805 [Hassallia byssoidea VB512170]|uniref:Uncharacterized protein n=1 Tax=Hassallia byssoidea VB512170 TaxID=1304833 RepID=A0A846HKR3_9CYAN|nr:hypothetical protein [Hassalia byssoidea]NEU76960.1 hypothetical protein [Hassalia byssoidea VB512170]